MLLPWLSEVITQCLPSGPSCYLSRPKALEHAQYISQQHGQVGESLLASEEAESTFIFSPLNINLL